MKAISKKKRFVAILCLFLFLFISACGGGGGSGGGSDDDNNDENITSLSGFDVLGRGYNVFDNYADSTMVKQRILDNKAMFADGLFEKGPGKETSSFTEVSGSGLEEYMQSLNTEATVAVEYSGFSGSLAVNFSEKRRTTRGYSYFTKQSKIVKYMLIPTMYLTIGQLEPYLTETARENLNDPDFTPEQVFDIYGTHVLTGVAVGARLDYNVSANMSQVDGERSISVYATASYEKGINSVEGEAYSKIKKNWSTFQDKMEKSLKVYGGSAELGQAIVNKDHYDAWIDSIEANQVFCDFVENQVRPIWEFCDSHGRSEEIKAYYDQYAQVVEPKYATSSCIIGLDIKVTGSSNVAEQLDNGYKVMYHDLNANAEGKYIFIYYKLGPDDGSEGTPITKIFTVNTTRGEHCPRGGHLIDKDLNKGAGGDFIYLGYFKEENKPPVRSIIIDDIDDESATTKVYSQGGNNEKEYKMVTIQDSAVKQDLNEGAGGNYIYVGYSYDPID